MNRRGSSSLRKFKREFELDVLALWTSERYMEKMYEAAALKRPV